MCSWHVCKMNMVVCCASVCWFTILLDTNRRVLNGSAVKSREPEYMLASGYSVGWVAMCWCCWNVKIELLFDVPAHAIMTGTKLCVLVYRRLRLSGPAIGLVHVICRWA